MGSRSLAWAVVTVMVGLTGVACMMPDSSTNKVIATSGVPRVGAGTSNQPPAALGATVEVSTENGTKAAYTVANLRPATPANEFTQIKGTLYSIDVTVQGEAGTVPVNPMYFSASSKDGTHLDVDFAAVDNQLNVSDLPQGQHVSGRIAFDVPTGQNIAQILLSGPLGSIQAMWSVS
jgi:Domain of unknown function (DUF1942)